MYQYKCVWVFHIFHSSIIYSYLVGVLLIEYSAKENPLPTTYINAQLFIFFWYYKLVFKNIISFHYKHLLLNLSEQKIYNSLSVFLSNLYSVAFGFPLLSMDINHCKLKVFFSISLQILWNRILISF